jgi:hypothetical protein
MRRRRAVFALFLFVLFSWCGPSLAQVGEQAEQPLGVEAAAAPPPAEQQHLEGQQQ